MTIKLKAQTRETREKLSSDFIPGVLYGKEIKNQILKIKKNDFDKTFKEAGESNLIDLDYGSGAVKVLVKDTQKDIIKGSFIHVDFYQVNMKEKTTAEIPLAFIGESKAVKELGGTLVKELNVLEVECLPSDLVDHLDIDISVLESFNNAIRVNDLELPSGLTLVRETNDVIAAVREPKAIEPEETEEAEVSSESEDGASEKNSEGSKENSEKKGEEKKENSSNGQKE